MNLDYTHSRWHRSGRRPTACRDHCTPILHLALANGKWVVTKDEAAHVLIVPGAPSSREDAIAAADQAFPPTSWAHDKGKWTRDSWVISPENTGWYIYRKLTDGELSRASVTEFTAPDRARRWAELRLDRGDGKLRGAKPRAGSRSTCKLPDVRVTPDEREAALALAGQMGLSYSQLARAAVRFVQEHVFDRGSFVVQEDDVGAPCFIPRDERTTSRDLMFDAGT